MAGTYVCEQCGLEFPNNAARTARRRWCADCARLRSQTKPRDRELLMQALDSSTMRAAINHAIMALRTHRYAEALEVLQRVPYGCELYPTTQGPQRATVPSARAARSA